MTVCRNVAKIVESIEKTEGIGAKVFRGIGSRTLPSLDPFLLFDEAKIKPPAGFPPHPHRGFQTVSYILKGKLSHEDFCGHKGLLGPGDMQWMTAGRGIVHSEIPSVGSTEEGHGLQLWINLRSDEKMCEPDYQEFSSKKIPKSKSNGVSVNILSGEALGVKSKINTRTPAMYLDFNFKPGAKHQQPIPKGWNAFTYTLSGNIMVVGQSVPPHHTAILEDGDFVTLANESSEKCRFLLIAGKPLNEPVARHGPFVMNTQEQIDEAIADYHNSRNGFENAQSWIQRENS
uniref:pirin-like n=1 Tax=Styela clava TaxID=7725 RepID=UPI0019394257|nr:pirin-like [Styela clava]